MKIITFLFGKSGDSILSKITYVIMILFVLTTDFLSIFNTDFTDVVDILLNLLFIILNLAVFRGLYGKFLKEFSIHIQDSSVKLIPKTFTEILFGKSGKTIFSKFIYIMMILYLLISFLILNIKYTDFSSSSQIIYMILGTIANFLCARIIYKKFFL